MNIPAWLHPEQKHAASAADNNNTKGGRGRLDTEETVPRNNVQKIPEALLRMGDENPFLECHQDYAVAAAPGAPQEKVPQSPLHKPQAVAVDPTAGKGAVANLAPLEVDCESTMSSLSSGSFKQRPPPVPQPTPQPTTTAAVPTPTSMEYHHQHHQVPTPRTAAMATAGSPRGGFVPPLEISFRVEVESGVPDWLQDSSDSTTSIIGLDHSYSICSYEQLSSMEEQQQDDNDTAENNSLTKRIWQSQQKQKKTKPKKQSKHRRTASAEVPLTPVWTGMPSPVNLIRPTLGRFKSVPVTALFPGRTVTPRANATTPQNNELSRTRDPKQSHFSYSPVVTPTPARHLQHQAPPPTPPHEEYTITPRSASLIIPVLRRRHTTTTGTPIVEVSSPRPSSTSLSHRRNPSIDSHNNNCCWISGQGDQASYLDLTVPTLASSSNTHTTNTNTNTNASHIILSNLSWTTAATNSTATTTGPKRSMVLQELKHILWRRRVSGVKEEGDDEVEDDEADIGVGATTAGTAAPKACHGCLT